MEVNEEVMRAEADKYRAEADAFRGEQRHWQLENQLLELQLESAEREMAVKRNHDINFRIFDYTKPFTDAYTDDAISVLSVWQRQNDKPITIRFNSPGGEIVAGLRLYDYIRAIAARDSHGKMLGPHDPPESKARGVYVTTIAWGMAASMAAVLIQAGNRRVAIPTSALLIHDAQAGASGSLGQLRDSVKFIEKQQAKIHDILTERSSITKEMLAELTSRKDYWMDADEALSHGLIDAKGYE